MARYNTTTPIAITSLDSKYEYLFKGRDMKVIYKAAMVQMDAMTDSERAAVDTKRYTWRSSDMYWRVAKRFYGDPRLWFVIAYYNKAPTEFHLDAGQDILVPISPRFILDKIGVQHV